MATKLLLSAAIVFLALLVQACEREDHPGKTGGPYYYTTFDTKSLPVVPSHEISEQEAKQSSSFYVAYFDERGHLVKFEKHVGDRIFGVEEYFYNADGKLTGGHYVDFLSGKTTPYGLSSDGKLRVLQ